MESLIFSLSADSLPLRGTPKVHSPENSTLNLSGNYSLSPTEESTKEDKTTRTDEHHEIWHACG